MEILRKDTMPDGTKIQLESWSEYHDTIIGAYPIAQRCSRHFIKNGKPFRLSIPTNKYKDYTADNVKADYEDLILGNKTLADLKEYFWNGEKDAYVLGLETTCTFEES